MEDELFKALQDSTRDFIKNLNFDSEFDLDWIMEKIYEKSEYLSHTFLEFLLINK